MPSIGNMLVVLVMAVVLMIISIPLIQQYGGSTATSQITGIINGTNTLVTNNVFNPLKQNTGNQTSTGFFAPITQFSGYAFVFGNIGNIIYALFQLPAALQTMLLAVMSPLNPILGASGANTSLILSLFETVLFIFLLIQGVSAWMKYSLW